MTIGKNSFQIFHNILKAREKKAEIIDNVLTNNDFVLTKIEFNIPGINKFMIDLTQLILEIETEFIHYLIENKFAVINSEKYRLDCGLFTLIKIEKCNLFDLKRKALVFEENKYYGLLDIDVYNNHGKQIHREDIDILPKKCYLCSKPAKICIRNQNHLREEVEIFFWNNIKKILKEKDL